MNCILHACVSAPLKKPELFCRGGWQHQIVTLCIYHTENKSILGNLTSPV